MNKRLLMALVLIFVMGSSLAGFAGLQTFGRLHNSQNGDQAGQDQRIPLVLDRQLTLEEKTLVLRSGRVVIESAYPPDCSECNEKNKIIDSFTRQLSGHIIFSAFADPTKETQSIIMTSPDGRVVDIEEVDQESLTNIFCDVSLVKPRECLLREI